MNRRYSRARERYIPGSGVCRLPPWTLALCVVALFGVGACGEKKTPPAPIPIPASAPVAAAEATDIGMPKTDTVSSTYVYTPVGKRDPFKSEYKVTRAPGKEEAVGGILTKFEIDQLKLTAIISGIPRPKAQVELPDGKGVTVKVGTRIGKNFGRVVGIKNDEVVVAEDYRDWSGRKVTNYIHIRMDKGQKKQRF